MTFLIKVCGLTCGEDAAFAAAQGADLLGFVWHPPSPRHCADLGVAVPFLDRAVLVQVSDGPAEILETARRHGFRFVQPYLPRANREQALQRLREAGLKVFLPWPDAAEQTALPADLYVWEANPAITGLPGGSGQGHDMAFPPPGPFLLAGGLDADNLALRRHRLPAAVANKLRGFDAASALERAPGLKDPSKVTAFIRTARQLESSSEDTHA